ncbi:hypothetical protein K491DRAFT_739935 [Lophiostoma macrostomum CBS 122681]|uniref:Uncharacterized protein n=1 Tax=Lophiostoma macrostomum CBS 122681 TaxID=1314788 RepID=A0A6A6TDX2_9PLEO|nr:hypothetical protein K491DRAFT_739935 [Lophiostoma macrostomum CBS 122681]
MKFLIFFTLSLATCAVAGPIAQPTDALVRRAVDCKKVNAALSVLKILGPPAKTFCSSYIHIPATATQTTTAVPSVALTQFSTVTTSTTTISTILPTCPASGSSGNAPAGKREVIEKRINLPALSAFAASQLSSGCSCLGLSPKTTTTTTFTPPPTKTVNVVATTTACSTCAVDGQPCDFDNPGACCGQACAAPGYAGNPQTYNACVSF